MTGLVYNLINSQQRKGNRCKSPVNPPSSRYILHLSQISSVPDTTMTMIGNFRAVSEEQQVLLPRRRRYRKVNQIIAGSIASLVIAMAGSVVGFTSITVPDLLDAGNTGGIHTSMEGASWFASIVSPACIAGCFFSGFIGENIGRKSTILLGCLAYVIGWINIAASPNFAVLLVGRVFTGAGIGLCEGQVQVYICEVCDSSIRAILSTSTGVTVMIGILYPCLLGSTLTWKMTAAACLLLPIVTFVGMVFMPESPYWLLRKEKDGGNNKAWLSLLWLRDGSSGNDIHATVEEFRRMQESDVPENQSVCEFVRRCGSPAVLRPFLLAVGLFFFQECAGVYSITSYQVTIFQMANATVLDEYTDTVVVGSTRVVAMICTCILLGYVGRRTLLIWSGVGMCASTACMGLYFHVGAAASDQFPWLPLILMLTFTISFCLGWEPIPFLLSAELLPKDVRGVGTGLCIMTFELFRFINVKCLPFLFEWLKPSGTFWAYSLMAFSGILYVWLLLPETKGKELADIEQMFNNNTTSKPHMNRNNVRNRSIENGQIIPT